MKPAGRKVVGVTGDAVVMEIDLDYVKSMQGGGVQVAGILSKVPEAKA